MNQPRSLEARARLRIWEFAPSRVDEDLRAIENDPGLAEQWVLPLAVAMQFGGSVARVVDALSARGELRLRGERVGLANPLFQAELESFITAKRPLWISAPGSDARKLAQRFAHVAWRAGDRAVGHAHALGPSAAEAMSEMYLELKSSLPELDFLALAKRFESSTDWAETKAGLWGAWPAAGLLAQFMRTQGDSLEMVERARRDWARFQCRFDPVNTTAEFDSLKAGEAMLNPASAVLELKAEQALWACCRSRDGAVHEFRIETGQAAFIDELRESPRLVRVELLARAAASGSGARPRDLETLESIEFVWVGGATPLISEPS